jgi:hypothetical protein
MGGEAGSAGHGGSGGTNTPRPLARPAVEGTERRVLDGLLVVVGQGQFNKAVKVLEHFRVALYRGLPIFVDASLQLRLGGGKLVRVRLGMVIMVCVGGEAFKMLGVGRLASLCEKSEVLKDIVLRMSSDPRSDVIVYRLHHAALGLPDGDLEALGLALAGERGRSVADGAVRVHPDLPFPGFGVIVSGIHRFSALCLFETCGRYRVMWRGEGKKQHQVLT